MTPFILNGFQALSDATRWSILQQVADQELPAGEIAQAFTVSRTAVSQHLTVLKQAGLLLERRDGTRRLYRADLSALGELRQHIDRLIVHEPLPSTPEASVVTPPPEVPRPLEAGPKTIARTAPPRPEHSGTVHLDLAVHASASALFDLLATAEGLQRWMAPEAQIEAMDGGMIQLSSPAGVRISGRIECCRPSETLVFGWGGIDGLSDDESRVSVQIHQENATIQLRLSHDNLPPKLVPTYRNLWRHSALPRLKAAVEGREVDGWVLQPPA